MSAFSCRLKWLDEIKTSTNSSGLIPQLSTFVNKVSATCADRKATLDKYADEKAKIAEVMKAMAIERAKLK